MWLFSSRRLRRTLIIAVLGTMLVQAKKPFQRMQQTTGQTESTKGSSTGPSVAYLQSIMREGGTDPIEAIMMNLASPGYKTLLQNADIQRRILQEMPLLKAFKPFKEILDKPDDDEAVKSGFAEGMKQAIDFMKNAFTTIKDPNATVDTLTKLATSSDAHTQETFKRARGGEKEAVEELQRLFAKEQFPGLDIDVLKEVANSHTFDKLLGMEEVMRFIDRDQHLSDVFRKPFKHPVDKAASISPVDTRPSN